MKKLPWPGVRTRASHAPADALPTKPRKQLERNYFDLRVFTTHTHSNTSRNGGTKSAKLTNRNRERTVLKLGKRRYGEAPSRIYCREKVKSIRRRTSDSETRVQILSKTGENFLCKDNLIDSTFEVNYKI